ncbi:MAG: hypothetical protein WBF43_04635 [Methylocella sp.]
MNGRNSQGPETAIWLAAAAESWLRAILATTMRGAAMARAPIRICWAFCSYLA